jgi:hypothetical protein
MGFDNTVDNRWRPDFEASRRRVHEEEAEERVVYSRELSFVPARRPDREDHDAQPRALIEQYARMEKLRTARPSPRGWRRGSGWTA